MKRGVKIALGISSGLLIGLGWYFTYKWIKNRKSSTADSLSEGTTNPSPDSIGFGSKNELVKIWQYVLGFKGADLGRSGPKGDGIDGVFGPRTLAASMRFYGKTAVSKEFVLAEKSRVDQLVAMRAEKIKQNQVKK